MCHTKALYSLLIQLKDASVCFPSTRQHTWTQRQMGFSSLFYEHKFYCRLSVQCYYVTPRPIVHKLVMEQRMAFMLCMLT